MRAPLHIYRENALLAFPTSPQATQQFEATDSEPEYFDAFSRDYVDLYVDTGVPELLLYLRHTTTLLPGRKDHAFFHYRAARCEELLTEFARILELNKQETLGNGAKDTTEAARRSTLPSALVESGLFEEGWSFDQSNRGGEVAMLVGRVEAGLPGLNELERETFLSLVEDQSQSLRFGVGSARDGVQMVQYLLESDVDAQIALSSGSAPSDLPVDILLISGYRNFTPLDDTTEQVFQQRLDKHKQEWQQRRSDRSHNLVDELVALTDDSDRPDHAIYNDIAALVRYVDYGDDVALRTEQAEGIRDHYDALIADRHLENKSVVIDELRERLVKERDALGEEIQDDRLDDFEELLESLEDSVRDTRRQYFQLGLVKQILSDSESSSESSQSWSELTEPSDIEPHRLTETLRERWYEFLTNDHLDDEIQTFVRETLLQNVRDDQNRLATQIIEKSTERFEKKLSNIGKKADSKIGRELGVYRAFTEIEQILDDSDDHRLEDIHPLARQYREAWQEFAESDYLDESIVAAVRRNVKSSVGEKKDGLEQHLESKTQEACEEATMSVLKQTDDPEQQLADVKELREGLDSPDTLQPGRNPTLQEAKELFERLDTDLKQEELRKSLRDTARHALSDGLAKAYLERIDVLIVRYCDEENSERAIEFLDEVETVNNTGKIHGSIEFHDEAKQALTTLEEAHSNTDITSDDKESVEKEVSKRVTSLQTKLADNQEEQYDEKIKRLLSGIEEEYTHQYEVQLDIYREIEEILKKDGRGSYEHAISRSFCDTWFEIIQDQAVTYEWRNNKENEIIKKIENEKKRLQPLMIRGDTEESSGTPWNLRSIAFPIAVVEFLLIVVILVAWIGVPFLGSDDGSGPELELEAPEMGERLDEEGVTVKGTTSANHVDLLFESRDTDQEFSKTIQVNDGEFEKNVEDIPIDRYRLSVTTNRTVTDDGDDEPDDSDPGDAEPDDGEADNDDTTTASHLGLTGNEAESSEDQDQDQGEQITGDDRDSPDETTETTVFTYLGNGPVFDISETDTDGADLTVDIDILRNVSSATVLVYDMDGIEVDTESVEVDNDQHSRTATLTVEDSGMHIVRVEPTHVSDTSLADQQIVNVPGLFDVHIENTNEPEAGDPLQVDVEIDNTGGTSAEQGISVDAQALGEETKDVVVDGDDTELETFSFETDVNDRGVYNLTAASEDTEDYRVVNVLGTSFNVSIEDTNGPVTEGEPLNVTVDITNTGEIEGTQSVTLDVGDLGDVGTEVSLDSGNATSETFTLETGETDAGTYEATVASDDDDDRVDITVQTDDGMDSLALGPAVPAGLVSHR